MPVARDMLVRYIKKFSDNHEEIVEGYRYELASTIIKLLNDEIDNLQSAILIKDRVKKHCDRLADFIYRQLQE